MTQSSTIDDPRQVIGNISCPERPPVNMVMKHVSEYKASAGKTWFSPTFLTHQLGYKLQLAVKVQPQQPQNEYLHLEVGIVLAPGDQEHYLKFPFKGDADVHILNPQQNKRHKFISIDFEINDESDYEFTLALVPKDRYVYKDCLFLCVEEICLDHECKTWLLDPNQEAEDSDSVDSEHSSEMSIF